MLQIDNCMLTMTYESLVMRSPKHRLGKNEVLEGDYVFKMEFSTFGVRRHLLKE